MRLDKFVAQTAQITRSEARKGIRAGGGDRGGHGVHPGRDGRGRNGGCDGGRAGRWRMPGGMCT